jgi:essential nuclear protein 1
MAQYEMEMVEVSRKRPRRNTENEDQEDNEDIPELVSENPNVVQMFKEIGEYMSHYRSGKIPKAFKSIPSLLNWEQVIEITCPEKWTAAAMLHATRLFSAIASPKACERFYRYYLLPRVLDDIMEYRKLNVHLFAAVKKAVYKPAAFIKGFLLPLCSADTFSLNAAHVIRGVLNSVSLPVFHAATGMIKISQLPISSPVSYVLTGMIYKRYTLPSLAVESLLKYFNKFEGDDEDELMPLSLNSCIHAFVQLYKAELTSEQREQLINLMKTKGHKIARQSTLKELDNLTGGIVTENMEEHFGTEMEQD